MRWVSAALFAAVLFAHYLYPYLDGVAGIGPKGWHLIGSATLQGVMGAALVPILLAARDSMATRVALAAVSVSILESIQTPPCRLLIGPHLSSVPVGANLCDHVTGWPITSVMYGIELMAVVAIVFATRRRPKP